MKKYRFAKAALVLGVVAACVFGLAACANGGGSEGIAATVNGTEIKEQDITDQIQQIREQSGLEDEDQWGLFLVQNDMTPSSVREQIINSHVEQELIKQGSKDLDISVESSEVDEYIDTMKANYDSDDAWKSALEQAGFTEDSYREVIEESLMEQKIGDYFEDEAEISDEDYVTSAQTYAPYYNGAKRSSHILFSVEDSSDEAAVAEATAQAQDVLNQINDGTLDFAEAARQYSGDTGSAENGGDVGWDTLNSFVEAYTEALANLSVGQVSEPVVSEYGVHIIKVTDEFNAPDEITSLDQIPEDFQDSIKEMAVSVKSNSDYTEWLDGLKENADIVINDMPSGLPYDIDLAPYEEQVAAEEAAEAEESESADTADSTEGVTVLDSNAEEAEDMDIEETDEALYDDMSDEEGEEELADEAAEDEEELEEEAE